MLYLQDGVERPCNEMENKYLLHIRDSVGIPGHEKTKNEQINRIAKENSMKKVLYEELLPEEFVQRMQALRKSTQK